MKKILLFIPFLLLFVLSSCEDDDDELDATKLAEEQELIEDWVKDKEGAIALSEGVYIIQDTKFETFGDKLKEGVTATVAYTGKRMNVITDSEGNKSLKLGDIFDSGTFNALVADGSQVVDGWVIGLREMKLNGRYVLIIPSKVGYKDYRTMYFEMKIESIR